MREGLSHLWAYSQAALEKDRRYSLKNTEGINANHKTL